METLDIHSTLQLEEGVHLPRLGLGLSGAVQGREAIQAVEWALDAGYRHFDTAEWYGNEEVIGEALRQSTLDREDIFITTKFWTRNLTPVHKAFPRQLERLGLGYVDLYLVHWPPPLKVEEHAMWRKMSGYKDAELVRSLGVSNYLPDQLLGLLQYADKEELNRPTANQVRSSPSFYPDDVHEFNKAQGIETIAYSPLGHGKGFDLQKVQFVAQNHRAQPSPSQVMLRWGLQMGMAVIPRASRQEWIKENADLYGFELSEKQMRALTPAERRPGRRERLQELTRAVGERLIRPNSDMDDPERR